MLVTSITTWSLRTSGTTQWMRTKYFSGKVLWQSLITRCHHHRLHSSPCVRRSETQLRMPSSKMILLITCGGAKAAPSLMCLLCWTVCYVELFTMLHYLCNLNLNYLCLLNYLCNLNYESCVYLWAKASQNSPNMTELAQTWRPRRRSSGRGCESTSQQPK